MFSNMVESYMVRRTMVLARLRNRCTGSPISGTRLRTPLKCWLARKYSGLARRWVRYRAMAPTFLEMDIPLSFRMTMRLLREEMLFIPS